MNLDTVWSYNTKHYRWEVRGRDGELLAFVNDRVLNNKATRRAVFLKFPSLWVTIGNSRLARGLSPADPLDIE